jgi:hypothetical protein
LDVFIVPLLALRTCALEISQTISNIGLPTWSDEIYDYFAKNNESFLDLANRETFAVIWFTPERGRVSASDNIGQVM